MFSSMWRSSHYPLSIGHQAFLDYTMWRMSKASGSPSSHTLHGFIYDGFWRDNVTSILSLCDSVRRSVRVLQKLLLCYYWDKIECDQYTSLTHVELTIKVSYFQWSILIVILVPSHFFFSSSVNLPLITTYFIVSLECPKKHCKPQHLCQINYPTKWERIFLFWFFCHMMWIKDEGFKPISLHPHFVFLSNLAL